MPKVYDCFLFSYGPDLLEIRLNTLNDVVDKFVIVEATHDWHGVLKGLKFCEPDNLKRFEKFLHKIEYVVVTDMPKYEKDEGSNDEAPAEKLESFNRNAIIRGLFNAEDEDIVIVSDFDEIPRPEVINSLKNELDVINILKTPTFFYALNSLSKNHKTYDPTIIVTKKKILKNYSIHDFRFRIRGYVENNLNDLYYDNFKINVVEEGGWHFTWVGDKQLLNKKLDYYRHEEFRDDEGRKKLESVRASSYKNKESESFINFKIDEYFPKYLVDNQEKYSHIISNNTVEYKILELINEYIHYGSKND
jgi:beta-1,4-mannosyl-glycoprotein beta-1,4-N-acetylglucosaminyltransferase